jgi:hypothetical protein
MSDGSDDIGLTKWDGVCGVCPQGKGTVKHIITALSLTTVKIQAYHSFGFSCDYEAIMYLLSSWKATMMMKVSILAHTGGGR